MKRKIYSMVSGRIYLLCALTLLGVCSCDSLSIENEKNVKLFFKIDAESLEQYKKEVLGKAQNLDYDTNKFILSIYSSTGAKVYKGKYSERPKEIIVTPGAYDISLYSISFKAPSFNAPLIGDEKTVILSANDAISIEFNCKQLNCAITLSFTQEFKNKFTGNGIKIVQGNDYLDYSYAENRYAYLKLDPFYLVYTKNSKDTVLLERRLFKGQMLGLNLTYRKNNTKENSFKVTIDTNRTWLSGNYNIGMNIPTGAVSIEEAKRMVGEKNVMVFGYIYGGDPTNISVRIAPPFTSRTTIVIAPSMAERNRNNCFVVELPLGPIREALNLVVNSNLLGSFVVITGDIVDSYFGYIGIKNTKAYKFIE